MKFIFIIYLFFCTAIYGKTVLFLGDSLTEGYGVSKNDSYAELLLSRLKVEGHQDLKFINGSISGSTTASGPSRMRWFLKAKPDILVLVLGANDGLRGLEIKSSYENLEKVILMAQKEKIKVLLVGVRMPPNYGKSFTKEFSQLFVNLAKKYKLAFVPQILKGVAGEEKLNQDDGIHPNEKGHKLMMENIYPKFKELL